MPIEVVINLLTAYQRYVNYMNNHGYDDVVDSIKENYNSLLITMRGHMGETYENEIYFSGTTGELCIESAVTHVSIFDVIDFEEYGITKELLNYFKFGYSNERV